MTKAPEISFLVIVSSGDLIKSFLEDFKGKTDIKKVNMNSFSRKTD